MTTQAEIKAEIQRLIPLRDAAKGTAKTALRKEIQAHERELAILQAKTARDVGEALYHSPVWARDFDSRYDATGIAAYLIHTLIGRNLMTGRTVRLDLENGYHVVCTLEKI